MTDAEYCDNLNSLGGGSSRTTTARQAPRKGNDWSRPVAAYIVKNPELSLGIALALGVGIALVLKRR